jgi:hypothetical protein
LTCLAQGRSPRSSQVSSMGLSTLVFRAAGPELVVLDALVALGFGGAVLCPPPVQPVSATSATATTPINPARTVRFDPMQASTTDRRNVQVMPRIGGEELT